jgi:hypothetical protein
MKTSQDFKKLAFTWNAERAILDQHVLLWYNISSLRLYLYFTSKNYHMHHVCKCKRNKRNCICKLKNLNNKIDSICKLKNLNNKRNSICKLKNLNNNALWTDQQLMVQNNSLTLCQQEYTLVKFAGL